jgi:hypothetical protein
MTALSAPRPALLRRGSTSFDHIGRISRGGPGRAIATPPSGRLTNQPALSRWVRERLHDGIATPA